MTLADRGRHVLLELPHEVYLPLDRLLADLAGAGLSGILSHPERNQGILSQPGVVKSMVQAGCLIQVTAESLTGGIRLARPGAGRIARPPGPRPLREHRRARPTTAPPAAVPERTSAWPKSPGSDWQRNCSIRIRPAWLPGGASPRDLEPCQADADRLVPLAQGRMRDYDTPSVRRQATSWEPNDGEVFAGRFLGLPTTSRPSAIARATEVRFPSARRAWAGC